MNTTKENMLASIRAALGRNVLSAHEQQTLMASMKAPPRGVSSMRASVEGEALITLFIQQAKFAQANVVCINSLSEGVSCIVQILKEEKLQPNIVVSQDLMTLSWQTYSIHARCGAYQAEKVSVTSGFAGVAETGTLVLISSPQSPTKLNFLPDIHIVFLNTKQIVPYYEDAWEALSTEKINPRVIHFITGPSRTGDIEQTVQIGAHGPKKLYIVLIEEENR